MRGFRERQYPKADPPPPFAPPPLPPPPSAGREVAPVQYVCSTGQRREAAGAVVRAVGEGLLRDEGHEEVPGYETREAELCSALCAGVGPGPAPGAAAVVQNREPPTQKSRIWAARAADAGQLPDASPKTRHGVAMRRVRCGRLGRGAGRTGDAGPGHSGPGTGPGMRAG